MCTVGSNSNRQVVSIVKKSGAYFWIAAMITVAACSVQENYHSLSFFFDGVPNPDEASQLAIDPTAAFTDSTSNLEKSSMPILSIHQPYRDKQCDFCHNQERMGELNDSSPGLCYHCHSTFENGHNFGHGPAAGGYCLECHNPHRATEKGLLVEQEEDLCLRCHNAVEISENIFHKISEVDGCVICHTPHGGDNQSLLQHGACYQCHENFVENYLFTHGPVAAGNCSTCHTPHREGSENLLIKTNQELCFYCHDAERLAKNENHPKIEDTFCADCHNPHASGPKNIFY